MVNLHKNKDTNSRDRAVEELMRFGILGNKKTVRNREVSVLLEM